MNKNHHRSRSKIIRNSLIFAGCFIIILIAGFYGTKFIYHSGESAGVRATQESQDAALDNLATAISQKESDSKQIAGLMGRVARP